MSTNPTNGPIEPAADLRQFASIMRQLYIALLAEGFTETEALAIIGHTLRGQLGGSS